MADDTGFNPKESSSRTVHGCTPIRDPGKIMSLRPTASLTALLAAAAALVPPTPATAADETNNRVSYRFSDYDEDALAAKNVIGDGERYRVLSQQFDLDSKFAGGAFALKLDATHEVMSGSSPWFVLPDKNGAPVQVLSGATIRDHRTALNATLTQDPGTSTNTTYSASYSSERDYHALAIGAERSQALDQAWTLGYGGSFSHDLIEPTDALANGRIQRATKNTASAFGSLALVLDRDSVVQAGMQFNLEHGYLSDPYKLFADSDGLVPEQRPQQRAQAAALVRWRRAFAEIDASLHLDYRYAQDSWGVHSHTLDAAWYQSFAGGWRVIPALRYYSQAAARFYAPYLVATATPQHYSADYRLGTFGAFSTSINVRKTFGHWEFSLGAERYHSAQGLALDGRDTPVPGLLKFTRAFAGLDFGFD
ncbi:MAG: DUF3570 domain-containing protein [Gammaproteobacteria bacterium]|nr:MAG: DUF3570 domain-containing protein [Gammaproteobacteria bacterium]